MYLCLLGTVTVAKATTTRNTNSACRASMHDAKHQKSISKICFVSGYLASVDYRVGIKRRAAEKEKGYREADSATGKRRRVPQFHVTLQALAFFAFFGFAAAFCSGSTFFFFSFMGLAGTSVDSVVAAAAASSTAGASTARSVFCFLAFLAFFGGNRIRWLC